MKHVTLLGMLAASAGLLSGDHRRFPPSMYAASSSGLKPRQRHNPARVVAAAEKRARRQVRNLHQVAQGGYGPDWQAL